MHVVYTSHVMALIFQFIFTFNNTNTASAPAPSANYVQCHTVTHYLDHYVLLPTRVLAVAHLQTLLHARSTSTVAVVDVLVLPYLVDSVRFCE